MRLKPEFTPTGRSTMQDSFQPFMTFVRTKSAAPVEKPLDVTTFDGTTTSRSSYLPWPMPPNNRGKKPAEAGWMGGNNAGGPIPNSTYRDMFREIKIPSGAMHQLGLQVVGGKFYPMLARGTKPPATKRMMMTTTLDKQTSLDVVVIITSDDQGKRGRKVGEFELDGITPSKAVSRAQQSLQPQRLMHSTLTRGGPHGCPKPTLAPAECALSFAAVRALRRACRKSR